MKRILIGPFLVMVILAVAASGFAAAQGKKGMGGWEKEGAYNKLYDLSEMDQIKGVVESIKEVTPLPGMSPAVALVIRMKDKETVLVHLGPAWFVKPNRIGVKKGDDVKVRGAWAVINDKDVFLASKVKKGDNFEFKVRLTKDGTPFWTMTPEELAKERASK